jgi:acetylornithine deacetylase
VEIYEPDRADFVGKPLYQPGMGFEGRPQLVARFVGTGEGKSLLFNGHIDAVSYEPIERWTSHPLRAEIRDGNLYGRGSCDMKGGIASMVFASEILAELGISLAGDLLVATNTDEESSGAGGLALVLHGVRADAGIVTEPTNFDVWISCRGTSYATISVEGRPGHAEVFQPHWREGGAVNAIEKAQGVLDAMRRLREEWRNRSDLRHPRLSVPDILPTKIEAGEWAVTYPAECRITIAVLYLPQQTDDGGWGFQVEHEVDEWIARAVASDPWLAENPPTIEWWPNRVMSLEIPPDEPIVPIVVGSTEDVGRPGRLSGLDSWYDGATFTRLGGTPAIAYGPPGFDPEGRSVAHTIDEHVPVDGLVDCAKGLAVAATRFCGVAS